MSKLIDMLQRLSDNYNKDENGNIAYLLTLGAEQLEDLEETLDRTKLWRDIDEAEGLTLDRIGRNVQEPRGDKGNSLYRDYIKVKIASNLSGGSIETLNGVLSVLLGDRDFWITEGHQFELPWTPEPAAILITVADTGEQEGLPFAATDLVAAAGVQVSYWSQLYPDSQIQLESEYEAYLADRDVYFCGTFAAGEELVL